MSQEANKSLYNNTSAYVMD